MKIEIGVDRAGQTVPIKDAVMVMVTEYDEDGLVVSEQIFMTEGEDISEVLGRPSTFSEGRSEVEKDIGGAGDAMTGAEVHTPVGGGGGGRKRRKLEVEKAAVGSRFLCGDSEEVLKALPERSVACVVTSPSYWGPNQPQHGGLGNEGLVGDYINKLTAVFKEVRRVLADTGSAWVVIGDAGHQEAELSIPLRLSQVLQQDGWKLGLPRIWDRGQGRQDTILHLTKGKAFYRDKTGAPVPSVLTQELKASDQEPRSRFYQYPVGLAERLIKWTGAPGGVVLDPFTGAGTTVLAARNLGRPGIGIDIDDAELTVARKRLGLPAVPIRKMLVSNAADYELRVLSKAQKAREPFIIAGYASPVIIDQEGHRISHEAFEKDLPRFMAEDGRYANVNVMHSNITCGRVIPEFTMPDGKTYKTQVDGNGLFVVAEIRTDLNRPAVVNQVIEDIENGTLRSFSISGNADNPVFTCEGERCYFSIDELELYEITLAIRDADIMTKEGLKAIAEMQLGDLVMTHRHNYRPVTKTHKVAYEGELIRLTLDDGRVLELTPEHRVRVKGRGWVLPTELQEGDELTQPTWSTRLKGKVYSNLTGGIKTTEGRARQVAGVTSPEFKRKRRELQFAKWQEPEYREQMLAKLKVTRERAREDEEFCARWFRAINWSARHVRGEGPNKLERDLAELVRRFGFEFIGDGRKFIAGKNPDFWNGNGKVIELYGDYWHRGQDPQERIDLFKAHGFETLVVWEREWREAPAAVAERVAEFAWVGEDRG